MKRGLILCLVVLGALIGFGVTTSSASAAETSVTVEPGATVRIPIRMWCLDFGKPFPTAIAGPVSRPPDAALLALQAAVARGATESDPYQTQLAIWRAVDGTFHDDAGIGHVLAQEIYSDSLKLTVSPAPTNTLELAVSQGSVTVTFENFTPISDTVHTELLPYTGTADLVVLNTSNESVTFIPLDGMVFNPASDMSEQTLISHLDVPLAPTTLPTTGGATLQTLWAPSLLLLMLAASLVGYGVRIRTARQAYRG
jgi:hypothetical protein